MKSFDIATLLNFPELPTHLSSLEDHIMGTIDSNNKQISDPLKRLAQTKGKRLRPALTLTIVKSRNKPINVSVIAACAAIELIHVGSLVHDDVIDNSMSRRNIATINSLEGVDAAVIIGDYLFAKAGMQAASVSVAVAQIISSTLASLCDGQMRELTEQHNLQRSLESMLLAIHGKTASLISSACEIGGLCAGLDDDKVKALAQFGEAFGMSFQLLDDVLDFLANPVLTGKPAGNDVKEGVYTMPLILSLQGRNGDRLRKTIKENATDHTTIIDVLHQDGSFAATMAEVEKQNQLAAKALDIFPENEVMNNLKKLPGIYNEWSIDTLVDSKYKNFFRDVV